MRRVCAALAALLLAVTGGAQTTINVPVTVTDAPNGLTVTIGAQTVTIPPPAPPAPPTAGTTVCGSATADSHALLLAALARSRVITITCPTRLVIGQDWSAPVFIPSNETINFTGTGQLIVDNALVPAFVMAAASNVTWNNANILYVGNFGSVGIVENFTPIHNFQYQTLKPYDIAHNGNTYAGPSAPMDGGGIVNMAAIFLLQGGCNGITWNHLTMAVPANATAAQFPAALFAFGTDYKVGYHTTNTPADSTLANTDAPANITINGATLDGSLMGLTGLVKSLTVSNVTSLRYADLQDAKGQNVGGVGAWFPPPHLFYLYEADSTVGNRQGHVVMSNVIDQGIRVGNPQGRLSTSGNASSFKVDLGNTQVTNYTTHRPDGCADFIYHFANGASTITNFTCFFDSSLTTIDGKHWDGVRFPGPGPDGYQNLTMSMTITDTAASPQRQIIDGMNGGANAGDTITATLYQHNPPAGPVLPEFVGTNIKAAITLHFAECPKGSKFSPGANVQATVTGC